MYYAMAETSGIDVLISYAYGELFPNKPDVDGMRATCVRSMGTSEC